MKLVSDEMRKYEYIMDVFKGTCELNNFEGIQVPVFDEDDNPCDDVVCEALAVKPEGVQKVYFYGSELGSEEKIVLGAVSNKTSVYSSAEIINMAVKFLSNLNVEDVVVKVGGEDAKILYEILEAADISTEIKGKDTIFSVYVEDEEVVFGGVTNETCVFISMNYAVLAEKVNFNEKKAILDVYVSPMQEDVLDDAFIIGTDLRDAGFRVEVDYSLRQVTKDDVDATFLVTFDKDDIAKYEVKLVDMATKELKNVKIDNLIEEIMFV